MPADILQNSLQNVDARSGHVDLYEITRRDTMPYSECLNKHLNTGHKYRGYAFTIHINPAILPIPSILSAEKAEMMRKKHPDMMRVTCHEYVVNCREERCRIRTLRVRSRTVMYNEIAVGPIYALVFSTKTEWPVWSVENIDNVMSYEDVLYSERDMNISLAKTQPFSAEMKGMITLFKYRALRANPNIVGLYSKYTRNINAIKKTARDAYLNIVHDCDRYCAVSTIGVIDRIPFATLEQDGIRCMQALKELPYSETYKSTYGSLLRVSKGFPHAHEDVRMPDYDIEDYIREHSPSSIMYNELLHLPERNSMMIYKKDADTSTSTVAIVIGCVLPAVVGSAMVAYVVRSNSKLAQSVRNVFLSITQTMRGMQRVVTHTEDLHCDVDENKPQDIA